jgi:hypothetical protein
MNSPARYSPSWIAHHYARAWGVGEGNSYRSGSIGKLSPTAMPICSPARSASSIKGDDCHVEQRTSLEIANQPGRKGAVKMKIAPRIMIHLQAVELRPVYWKFSGRGI